MVNLSFGLGRVISFGTPVKCVDCGKTYRRVSKEPIPDDYYCRDCRKPRCSVRGCNDVAVKTIDYSTDFGGDTLHFCRNHFDGQVEILRKGLIDSGYENPEINVEKI